jgi:hypothetical protein
MKPEHEGLIGDLWFDSETQTSWTCLGGTEWAQNEPLPPVTRWL